MGNELLSVRTEELKFVFEQNKQSCCELQLLNNTENYVAFKVKTTSPKKYFVRPNTGVILPRSSIDITLAMQAQPEAPPYMQCKDKFLLLSVVVPSGTEQKDITPDVFNKDTGKNVEECKLRVRYVSPNSPKSGGLSPGLLSSDNENQDGPSQDKDNAPVDSSEITRDDFDDVKPGLKQAPVDSREITRDDFDDVKPGLKQTEVTLSKPAQERDASFHQCQCLQQDLASSKKQGFSKAPASGFTFLYVIIVGLLGILFGYYAHS